jgi:hypothetical protein
MHMPVIDSSLHERMRRAIEIPGKKDEMSTR